ncbi:MAG TPA: tetratricopeptide repeat protein [Armatimonadota bacterium]
MQSTNMIIAITLTLWAGVVLLPARANAQTDTELLKPANQAMTEKNYDKAASVYASFLQQSPRSPQAPTAASNLVDCYMALTQWDKALTALNVLEQQYPQYPYQGKRLSRKAVTLLALGKPDQADRVWNDLLTLGSQPDSVWPVIEAEYQYLLRTQGKVATDKFDRFSTFADLPMGYTVQERLLWFQHLYATKKASFITQGSTATGQANLQSREALLLPVMLASRLYEPLLKGGAEAEATALRTRMRNALTLFHNPMGWQGVDLLAYIIPLSKYAPDTYVAQMKARVEMLKLPLSPAELTGEVTYIGVFYDFVVFAGRVEGILQVHDVAAKELARIGDPELIQMEQARLRNAMTNLAGYYYQAANMGLAMDARKAHEIAQAAFPRLQLESLKARDESEFNRAMSRLPINGFWQQFKLGLAFDDLPRAQKWLDMMIGCAPDQELTKRAQQLMQQARDPQPVPATPSVQSAKKLIEVPTVL